MCKKNSQLIVAGLALIAISLLFVIFVLADSQYMIQGQVGSESLRMDNGVTHFCWKVRLEEYCVKWTGECEYLWYKYIVVVFQQKV